MKNIKIKIPKILALIYTALVYRKPDFLVLLAALTISLGFLKQTDFKEN
ncbi:unnamed protein product [Camellia sinensis]